MFWVFCCGCFSRPALATQRKFYLGSCTHIYCDRCLNHSYPYCRRCCVNIKVIVCDSKMPAEVRSIFCDAIVKSASVVKAMEYQAGQRYGLVSHFRGTESKYAAAKAAIKDAEMKYACAVQKLESCTRKIKELELANESIKKQLLKIRQSPTPSPPGTPWFARLNLPQRRSPIDTPAAPFTPRNCYGRYGAESPFDSAYSSSKSPSSRFSSNRSVPGCTPPQKTLELLNILNKKREFNL